MKPFERWSLWITTVLTGGTGVAYWYVKYFMEPTQPWAVINHPIQPWLLKAHIVVAPLMLFAVGMVTLGHIWRHFRARVRWGRKTGLTAMVALAPMVLTGYAIQVITHEGWLRAMAWSHIAFGILYLAGFVLHARVFRGPPPNGNGGSRPERGVEEKLSHRASEPPSPGTKPSPGRPDARGAGPKEGVNGRAPGVPTPPARDRSRAPRAGRRRSS